VSDNYQAIYDAMRSRIGNADIEWAVQNAIREANLSRYAEMASRYAQEAAREMQRPSVVFRPKLSADGDQWCALLGDNLQEGLAEALRVMWTGIAGDAIALLPVPSPQVVGDDAAHEREVLELIDERDAAEEALSQAYFLVMGFAPVWSNLYGHEEALEDIGDMQRDLRLAARLEVAPPQPVSEEVVERMARAAFTRVCFQVADRETFDPAFW
jgi:hypothetical protein